MEPWEGETSMEGGGKGTNLRSGCRRVCQQGTFVIWGRAHLNRTGQGRGACIVLGLSGWLPGLSLPQWLTRYYSLYRKYYLQRV